MKPKQKMVQTEEDWYPSFYEGCEWYDNSLEVHKTNDPNKPAHLVRVSLHKMKSGYRVCVWGADDFGLEKDIEDLTEATECYRKIKPLVKEDELRSKGFVTA